MDSSPASAKITNITHLNDDCLREVFRVLDLSDLCTVADVCNRFRRIAQETFKASNNRHLKLHAVCRNDEDQEMRLQRITNLLRHFGAFVESMDANGSHRYGLHQINDNRIVEEISRYCSSSLTKLKLDNFVTEPNGSHGRFILRHGRVNANHFVYLITHLKKLKIFCLGAVWGLIASDITNICKHLKQLTKLHLTYDAHRLTAKDLFNLIENAENLEVFRYSEFFLFLFDRLAINVDEFKKLVHIVQSRRQKKSLTIDFSRCRCKVKITEELAAKHKDLLTFKTIRSNSDESESESE